MRKSNSRFNGLTKCGLNQIQSLAKRLTSVDDDQDSSPLLISSSQSLVDRRVKDRGNVVEVVVKSFITLDFKTGSGMVDFSSKVGHFVENVCSC